MNTASHLPDRRHLRCLLLCAGCAALWVLIFSAEAARVFEIEYDPSVDKLSISAADISLAEVLEAVGDRAGIQIMGAQRYDAPVRIELNDVAVQTALNELLVGYNFTMAQDPETGRPVKLWLMSRADPAMLERARQMSLPTTNEKGNASPDEDGGLDIAEQLRKEILALGDGESEEEVLKNLGLEPADVEELLLLLEEFEAGVPLDEIQH